MQPNITVLPIQADVPVICGIAVVSTVHNSAVIITNQYCQRRTPDAPSVMPKAYARCTLSNAKLQCQAAMPSWSLDSMQ